jgi:hypothetical protein
VDHRVNAAETPERALPPHVFRWRVVLQRTFVAVAST